MRCKRLALVRGEWREGSRPGKGPEMWREGAGAGGGGVRFTDGDGAGEGSYDQAEAEVDPRGEG